MGLDVYAVTKYELIDKADLGGDCGIFHKGSFEYQFGDLPDDRYYEVTEYGCSDFSCGYGRYSDFREWLAELAGHEPYNFEEPNFEDPEYMENSHKHRNPRSYGMIENKLTWGADFAPIIHFSDCEGYICNKVCGELSSMFEKHKEKVVGHPYEGMYSALRGSFRDAFESGGFVKFS